MFWYFRVSKNRMKGNSKVHFNLGNNSNKDQCLCFQATFIWNFNTRWLHRIYVTRLDVGLSNSFSLKASFESKSKWSNGQKICYKTYGIFLPFYHALYVNLENEKKSLKAFNKNRYTKICNFSSLRHSIDKARSREKRRLVFISSLDFDKKHSIFTTLFLFRNR